VVSAYAWVSPAVAQLHHHKPHRLWVRGKQGTRGAREQLGGGGPGWKGGGGGGGRGSGLSGGCGRRGEQLRISCCKATVAGKSRAAATAPGPGRRSGGPWALLGCRHRPSCGAHLDRLVGAAVRCDHAVPIVVSHEARQVSNDRPWHGSRHMTPANKID
jgi:hypothetical protein